jgi:hypothetical protein
MTAVGHGLTAAERHAPVDDRPTRSWDLGRVRVGLVCGRRTPRTGLSFDRRSTVGGGGEGVAEGLLVALPRAVQAIQAGVVGVGAGFVEDQRIAGGEGLDFAVGEGVVADVVDLALVELAGSTPVRWISQKP